jgi:error-prone DNA polymerase
MSFTHLHTASGYSLRYGASHPHELAARAAERGLDALALTDRESLAGAVRFAKACAGRGPTIVRGGPRGARRTDVRSGRRAAAADSRPGQRLRGGSTVSCGVPGPDRTRLGRVVPSGVGIGGLLGVGSGHRLGRPGRQCARGCVRPLGADSEVGQALASGRLDRSAALLGPWRERFGSSLRLEASWHGRSGTGPGSLRLAARLAGFAVEQEVAAVVGNAVRYADPHQSEARPGARTRRAWCRRR